MTQISSLSYNTISNSEEGTGTRAGNKMSGTQQQEDCCKTDPVIVIGLLNYFSTVSVTSNYGSTVWLLFLYFIVRISIERAMISIDILLPGIHNYQIYICNYPVQ